MFSNLDNINNYNSNKNNSNNKLLTYLLLTQHYCKLNNNVDKKMRCY